MPARLKRFLTAPDTLAVMMLTALWALFFWQLLTPTHADRMIFRQGDFPLHFFSFSSYQAERLWDGEIPLWDPYNYGGDPFAANVQSEVWYPPRWIAIALAGEGGWQIESHQLEVAAHYWLASLMMYAFLRVLVKRPWAALIGAVLWAYGGYLTGYPMLQPSILEAVTWLPLMMLGVHLSITDPRWSAPGMVLAALMVGLSFLGGHTQTIMQMAYLAAAYIVYLGWQHKLTLRNIVWRIAVLGGLGMALCAVQLLPALEFMRLSYRTETFHYADTSVGFTVTEWAQILWPRLFDAEYWPLYLGVPGLLLAISAILRSTRQHLFWIGAIAIGLWLSLGGYSIVYDVFYLLVPGFSTFREQERAASIAVFSLVVLVAHEIDWLLGSPRVPTGSRRNPPGVAGARPPGDRVRSLFGDGLRADRAWR